MKTHRCAELARRQLGPGTHGLTCATVAEAEVMVAAGFDDVLVANEVVSRAKLARLVALASRARIALAVDSAEPVSEMGRLCAEAGVELDVLVDVDVGIGRCGVAGPAQALALATLASSTAGVRFAGLMGYEGRQSRDVPDRGTRIAGAYERLSAARRRLEQAGLRVPAVSGGGTSTLMDGLAAGVLTEIQAGTYALMEEHLDGLGLPFRPAVAVAATVVSRGPGRLVVDAGLKALGCQYGAPTVLGLEAEAVKVAEEHTILRIPEGRDGMPELGGRVLLRPSSVSMTFPFYSQAWLVRDGDVEGSAPVGSV